MKRILWIVFGIALITFIAFKAINTLKNKEEARTLVTGGAAIAVELGNPTISAITDRITHTGTIAAQSEVTLYSKVPGKLIQNLVRMSDVVSPGQVVALIDRDEVGFEFSRFEVKSSAAGSIARVLLNPGAVVNTNSPLFSVVDVDTVKAVVAVPEDRIRLVTIGHPATVTTQAYPDQLFAGRVANISPVANPVSRTVDVEVRVFNPRRLLKPGMFAQAELVLSRRPALLVPLSAVTEREGKRTVFVTVDSTVSARSITTGSLVADSIEITSGLVPSDRIVVSGTQRLNDGDRIAPVK